MQFKRVRLLGLIMCILLSCSSVGTSTTYSIADLNRSYNHTVLIEAIDESPSSTKSMRIFESFHVGFGGSGTFGFESITGEAIWVKSVDLVLDDEIEHNLNYHKIKYFDSKGFDYLQQKLKNSKFLVYWFAKDWHKSSLSTQEIQKAMDQGYIPVFNYWYFGDELRHGLPNEEEQQAYYEHNQKIAKFLKELKGTKIVIMEPEFNKNNITYFDTTQEQFALIIGNAIDTIKFNTQDVLFSLCMMDTGNRGSYINDERCGYEHCALGDQSEWIKPHIIYNNLADKLDFISFNQMIGSFSRNHSNPGTFSTPNPQSYSNDALGIDYLAKRINNMAKFLHEHYDKPIFIPHLAIATATWIDENQNGAIERDEIDYEGWEEQASRVYKELMDNQAQLLKNGLFGFAVMALFDNPRQDYHGYQYYLDNEYHFGIIKTSAKDAVDRYRLGDLEFKKDMVETIFAK